MLNQGVCTADAATEHDRLAASICAGRQQEYGRTAAVWLQLPCLCHGINFQLMQTMLLLPLLVAAGISLVQADTPEMRVIAKQNRDKVLYCVIDTVRLGCLQQQQLRQHPCANPCEMKLGKPLRSATALMMSCLQATGAAGVHNRGACL